MRTHLALRGLKGDAILFGLSGLSPVLTSFAKYTWRSIAFIAAAAIVTASSAVRAASTFEVPPLSLPGPYPVACSNVVQDFTRVASGESPSDYWEGIPRSNGGSRYATDLLADPANTLSVAVTAPSDRSLFGSFAGRVIPYVIVVCYPTTSTNSRPDYVLPTGKAIPHMQRGSEAPLLADPTTRFPLLLFSHGYGGSPISGDYVDVLLVLASFGYVVAAPFHGDPRFSELRLDNLNDFFYLLTHLQDFTAMQALRPLSMSATIDLLLSDPQWSGHLDAAKIGGFGASQGGETLLLMAGAGLTKSIGLSWSKVTNDTRLKAAVGYVPYFGQPVFPAFGRDQHGLDGVALPYLAISGTADTTAPIAQTAQGISRLSGPRELVALTGVDHHFDVASTNDIFTWIVTFLDAKVRGDPAALERLRRMTSVAGGGDDRIVIPYTEPNFTGLWWNAPAESESGWGISLAHQGDVIFAAWFSYDLNGKGRWLVMTAPNTGGNTFAGTLYEVTGPPFDAVPFDPTQVTRTAVGTGTLTFTGADNGTFAYTVNGISQTKAITREVFGPLPSCIFGAQPDPALATNYQDLWWNAPGDSESGWGINFAHEGDSIFATWFTYDHDHTPMWLAATANRTMPGTYVGTLYRTTGPPFNAVPFNPAAVVRTAVGNMTLTFANGNSATFAYTVNGVSQIKTITREIFRTPGTVCQ
jgi:predicted dienelactone hydrolase